MKTCCGPTLSTCGIILSIWGIIQLAIMGAFFWVHSVNLVEDISVSEEDFIKHPDIVDDAYKAQAKNCWIVAGIYVALLALSAQQMWANLKPKPFTGM